MQPGILGKFPLSQDGWTAVSCQKEGVWVIFKNFTAYNIYFQLQILLFPPLFPSTSLRLPKILLYQVPRCHEFNISTGHHTGNWTSVRIPGPEWPGLILC